MNHNRFSPRAATFYYMCYSKFAVHLRSASRHENGKDFRLLMNASALLAVSASVLVAPSSASERHAPAAEFDRSRRVTLTGKVTKVEWRNPHVWFYMNVKDEKTG